MRVCVCVKFLVEIVELQYTRIAVLNLSPESVMQIYHSKTSVSPRTVLRLPTSKSLRELFNGGGS